MAGSSGRSRSRGAPSYRAPSPTASSGIPTPLASAQAVGVRSVDYATPLRPRRAGGWALSRRHSSSQISRRSSEARRLVTHAGRTPLRRSSGGAGRSLVSRRDQRPSCSHPGARRAGFPPSGHAVRPPISGRHAHRDDGPPFKRLGAQLIVGRWADFAADDVVESVARLGRVARYPDDAPVSSMPMMIVPPLPFENAATALAMRSLSGIASLNATVSLSPPAGRSPIRYGRPVGQS